MEVFGEFEGQPVHRVTLQNEYMSASLLNWGATLQDLRLGDQKLVLGFDTFQDYKTHGAYFGATVGRFANRIAGGRFVLEGKAYDLPKNDGGNTLHGGPQNFGNRLWTFEDLTQTSAVLGLISNDGDMGFPNDLHVKVRFELHDQTLKITYSATANGPTLCNLAHHSYFNLDGSSDARLHEFTCMAHHYLPVDTDQIPTGDIKDVANTRFDYREGEILDQQIDHCFCFEKSTFKKLARLLSNRSKIRLDVYSDQLGLQVYDGQYIPNAPYSGIALEPAGWPDSPNHPRFPQARIDERTPYFQRTEFRFSKG